MGATKSSDHIQIKIKMSNLSQKPPASSKTLNQDLGDLGALSIFQIKIESQNLEHRCIKDQHLNPNQNNGILIKSELL